jgi:hypothetical protein
MVWSAKERHVFSSIIHTVRHIDCLAHIHKGKQHAFMLLSGGCYFLHCSMYIKESHMLTT